MSIQILVQDVLVGIVTMLYFSEDGSKVQVRNYSTIQAKYYISSNQFEIDLAPADTSNAFSKVQTYAEQFADVAKNAWYYSFVKAAYEIGLVGGTSQTAFSPEQPFTVAQALTAAANIHKIYHGNAIRAVKSGEAWYTPYVEYCTENGIIVKDQFKNYDASITRGEMGAVFASILPEAEYAALRSGNIPDVTPDMPCAAAVQKLYDAGIVGGDTGTGNYRPNEFLKRSEACVIFTRIALRELRAK